MLGLDPLYVANEGKLMAAVAGRAARMRFSRPCVATSMDAEAAIIGHVVAEHPGRVVLKTTLGTRRILNTLAGEQLPRIC